MLYAMKSDIRKVYLEKSNTQGKLYIQVSELFINLLNRTKIPYRHKVEIP